MINSKYSSDTALDTQYFQTKLWALDPWMYILPLRWWIASYSRYSSNSNDGKPCRPKDRSIKLNKIKLATSVLNHHVDSEYDKETPRVGCLSGASITVSLIYAIITLVISALVLIGFFTGFFTENLISLEKLSRLSEALCAWVISQRLRVFIGNKKRPIYLMIVIQYVFIA